ncbi:MAG: DUF45 domain-containing protein [Parabacteroides sp.]|nr:DUF45 domain-containing protein [Parabacteroides sp.]
MEKIIQDKELGEILLRTSTRAKHYTLKISKGKLTATMPIGGDATRMWMYIQDNREKLRNALLKHPARPLIDEQTQLQTATFHTHIFRADSSKFVMKLEKNILHISCPIQTDFAQEEVQSILKGFIERALRYEAKRLLPSRLHLLAQKYGFSYSQVKILNSKSHWGSCTIKRHINLSLSLMLLPWHLIDYVLLHELCHTIEMNHSERFWSIMNQVTDNKAISLKKELKNYHML